MKNGRFIVLLAVAFAFTACEGTAPLAPETAVQFAKVKPLPYVFTKIPATWASHNIVTSTSVNLFTFHLETSGTKPDALTRVAIRVSGSLQAGDVGNYQLVYYPDGLTKPGVVAATNDGSTWVAPGGYTFIEFVLTTPLSLGQNFKGDFAMLADINSTGTFFVWTQLQTVSVTANGIERMLLSETCDLPLLGDTYYVN